MKLVLTKDDFPLEAQAVLPILPKHCPEPVQLAMAWCHVVEFHHGNGMVTTLKDRFAHRRGKQS